jgi:hypothetical protein
MSKSVHFPQYGGVNTEQQLVQDLVDEQIKLFGMDVFYIPRQLLVDKALNDIVLSRFKQYYMIEMMLINVEGFGGAGAVAMSKFGLALTDEMTLAVSKRRWQSFVSTKIQLKVPTRPNEGDLIYVPMTKNTYEIKFVEREVPFYQLGKNYIYSLSCELMQNANTEFDTGIDELDNLDQESYGFWITLAQGGTGSYIEGEQVSQTYTPNNVSAPVSITATVADWRPLERKVKLIYLNGVGDIQSGVALVGEDSGASWTPDTFSTLDIDVKNNKNNQNKYFEDAADNIIDFSEGNPFGEFGNMGDEF